MLLAVLRAATIGAVWHLGLANGTVRILINFWVVLNAAAAAIVAASAAGAELQLALGGSRTIAAKSNARHAAGHIVIGHIIPNTGALHSLWQAN